MYEKLTDENFLIYCAKVYDNPQCHSTDEFLEDLQRIKYIKKLITRYVENSDLKERLILNHLIILNNVFGGEFLCRILYLKMRPQYPYLKPFLILLNILPEVFYNVRDELVIKTDIIPMDNKIVEKLRELTNE
jgi:uncharacterized protein (DUF1919 family)